MIIPFKKEHLDVMVMRDHEKVLITPERAAFLEQSSIAKTGIEDGRVVACGGLVPFGFGNAEIWLIPSVYVAEYIKVFCKELKDWLFQVREDLALTRMETACLDDDLHTKWMEYLGFECEGLKRKFVNGRDYKMWARLWEA